MLDHADIQTTLINMHERDCIVNTAEHHIPTCSLPLSPRGYQTVHSRGGRGEKEAYPGGPSRREARPARALGRKSHGTIDVRR
jgi:hypothetical protein